MREVIDLTKNLMKFKSMHSNRNEIDRCANFIVDYLNKFGISSEYFVQKGYPSILSLPQKNFSPIILMSHIDVVDAPDKLFNPLEKDDKLYGRGSIDDKYAAALSLVLLKEHWVNVQKRGGTQKDLPFGILITGDEEIGGKNGAKPVLSKIKSNFCIALDGGDNHKIVLKEKGMLKLRLIAEGKTAHGARPWLGDNAIEKLIRDYQKIKTNFNVSSPDHWHRTMNLSFIHAGKSHNQVPERAEALFDIRYTEHDNIKELIEEMNLNLESKIIVESLAPLFRCEKSPYLDLLLEISKGTQTGFEHGASDARYLAAHGIDGIVWGANGDMSQHAIDEHVNIPSVYDLYDVLDEFMNQSKEISDKMKTGNH